MFMMFSGIALLWLPTIPYMETFVVTVTIQLLETHLFNSVHTNCFPFFLTNFALLTFSVDGYKCIIFQTMKKQLCIILFFWRTTVLYCYICHTHFISIFCKNLSLVLVKRILKMISSLCPPKFVVNDILFDPKFCDF